MNKNKDKNFDNILNQTLKYAKKLAKEFYFNNWSKNPPSCPAFGGEIVNITREGWEHILSVIKKGSVEKEIEKKSK